MLKGLGGNDVLEGGAGEDKLYGGPGADVVTAGGGADAVSGGTGNDQVAGGAGPDTLSGNAGADSVNGGDGADKEYGGDGNDTVVGGDGNDLILGQGGNDDLSGQGGSDTINGGAGTNWCTVGATDKQLACVYDRKAPSLAAGSFTAAPGTVDVTKADRTVKVRMRMRDDTGVSRVQLTASTDTEYWPPAGFAEAKEGELAFPAGSVTTTGGAAWDGTVTVVDNPGLTYVVSLTIHQIQELVPEIIHAPD